MQLWIEKRKILKKHESAWNVYGLGCEGSSFFLKTEKGFNNLKHTHTKHTQDQQLNLLKKYLQQFVFIFVLLFCFSCCKQGCVCVHEFVLCTCRRQASQAYILLYSLMTLLYLSSQGCVADSATAPNVMTLTLNLNKLVTLIFRQQRKTYMLLDTSDKRVRHSNNYKKLNSQKWITKQSWLVQLM